MHSVRTMIQVAAIFGVLLAPLAANALTVDRVTVTGHAATRERAILEAEQTAVAKIVARYVAPAESEKKRLILVDQVLPYSKSYLHAFEIVEERVDDEGYVEITALAGVEVGRLVTTLRNLDIEVRFIHLGPVTQCC